MGSGTAGGRALAELLRYGPSWPGGGLAVAVVERQAVAVHGLQRELLALVIEGEAVALPAAVALRWRGCCAAGRAGQAVA